jgi:peptidylprolyl isomerase
MIKKMILITLLFLPFYGVTNEPSEEIDYSRLSATLGHLIVRQLNQAGFAFDLDQVIQGIRDEREGKPSPMSEEEYEQVICTLQEQHFLQTAEKNLSQADTFLKENALKEGIQSVDQKLQFSVAREGAGESIGPESTPLIHYTGKLIDGTIFATSETLGEPVALPIKQSIPGFAKGLVGMKEGEKRVLYIHPELAYGLSGQLPPNSLLIFEVEVVKANALNTQEIAQTEPETSTPEMSATQKSS